MPAALPSTYTPGYVVFNALVSLGDTDGDGALNGEVTQGSATFTPVVPLRRTTGVSPAIIVGNRPITAKILDGRLVSPAGTPRLALPVGFWQVAFDIPGVPLPSATIEVRSIHTQSSPLDLVEVLTISDPTELLDLGEALAPSEFTYLLERISALEARPVSSGEASSAGFAGSVRSYDRDRRRVDRSLRFIRGMMQSTKRRPATRSELVLDRPYPDSWTGPVRGRLRLDGIAEPAAVAAPVTVADPANGVADGYRGMVFGATSASGWVRAFLVNPKTGGRYDTGLVTQADASGNWALDLSSVQQWRVGYWEFYRVSSSTSTALSSPPHHLGPYLTGLTVRPLGVTDTDYPGGIGWVGVDGSIYAPSVPLGRKVVYVTNATLTIATTEPISGVARSYVVESGQAGYGTNFVLSGYVYDQALALLAAIAGDDEAMARDLLAGLLEFQRTTAVSPAKAGDFIFTGPQHNPKYGDTVVRVGASAVATYALLAFMRAFPESVTPLHTERATLALSALASYQQTGGVREGLLLGGVGTYTMEAGGIQRPNLEYAIDWVSTEHNLDAFWAFDLAEKLLPGNGYGTRATRVRGGLLTTLWNAAESRFNQGYQTSGPDTADALDLHSWGAIFLKAIGEDAKAIAIMTDEALEPFITTVGPATGYGIANPAKGGYDGLLPNVWSEGTFGVALALHRLGFDARAEQAMRGIDVMQHEDGGYRYVQRSDPSHELTPYRSVAGSAWSVLAVLDGIWTVATPAADISGSGSSGGYVPKMLLVVRSPETARPTSRTDVSVLWVGYSAKPAGFMNNADLLGMPTTGTTAPPQDPNAADQTKPTAPTNLTVSSTTSSTITVTWGASTDNVGVAGYEASTDGSTWVTTTGSSQHTFTSLAASTAYTPRIRAYDAAGNRSDPVSTSASTSASSGGGGTGTEYTVFGTTAPSGTVSAAADGTPSIVTATGFYTNTSAATGWKCAGGRVWIPAGSAAIGQTITIAAWAGGAYGSVPNLAGTPLASGTTTAVAGWNTVRWTPFTMNISVPATYISSAVGAFYTAVTGLAAAAQASTMNPNLYIGESGLRRACFRIGSGSTVDSGGSTYYGHDIIVSTT